MSGKSQGCLPPPRTAAGGTSPPAAPVLSGVAQLRHGSQPGHPGWVLPLHGFPMVSCPPAGPWHPLRPAAALRRRLPHHWAQQSAGWSSFQSCHFFFISDFTCHGGGESGGFSLAEPSPQTEQARAGMAKPPAEAGLSPSGGQEKLPQVRTSLLAKQYSTATRKPWRKSRGVSPHCHPFSRGWDGLSLPGPFLGGFGAEVPPATTAHHALNNKAGGGRAGVPLPEPGQRLGCHGESELEEGPPPILALWCAQGRARTSHAPTSPGRS